MDNGVGKDVQSLRGAARRGNPVVLFFPNYAKKRTKRKVTARLQISLKIHCASLNKTNSPQTEASWDSDTVLLARFTIPSVNVGMHITLIHFTTAFAECGQYPL